MIWLGFFLNLAGAAVAFAIVHYMTERKRK